MAVHRKTLKMFDLRYTDCREDVLEVFSNNNYAFSHSDLEESLKDRFDRVTIYRTLKTFLDKGIIHKVLDEGGTKYALCQHNVCSLEAHNHDHVHFKCSKCGLINCLDGVFIPPFLLPLGYQRLEVNMLVEGICPSCQK